MTVQIEPPKQINLGIDDYRVATKRGRFINRDNWPLYFAWCFPIGLFWIGYAFWTRDEGPILTTIGVAVMGALIIGIGIGGWFKRFD